MGRNFVSHTFCNYLNIWTKSLICKCKSHTAIENKIKIKLFQFQAIIFTASLNLVSSFAKRPKTSLRKNTVQKYKTAQNCPFPTHWIF